MKEPNNPNGILLESQTQFEKVKPQVDAFIASINPTDSKELRRKIWEDLDKILIQLHPIVEVLNVYSSNNPDDNSAERELSHDIRDYILLQGNMVEMAINPDLPIY